MFYVQENNLKYLRNFALTFVNKPLVPLNLVLYEWLSLVLLVTIKTKKKVNIQPKASEDYWFHFQSASDFFLHNFLCLVLFSVDDPGRVYSSTTACQNKEV